MVKSASTTDGLHYNAQNRLSQTGPSYPNVPLPTPTPTPNYAPNTNTLNVNSNMASYHNTPNFPNYYPNYNNFNNNNYPPQGTITPPNNNFPPQVTPNFMPSYVAPVPGNYNSNYASQSFNTQNFNNQNFPQNTPQTNYVNTMNYNNPMNNYNSNSYYSNTQNNLANNTYTNTPNNNPPYYTNQNNYYDPSSTQVFNQYPNQPQNQVPVVQNQFQPSLHQPPSQPLPQPHVQQTQPPQPQHFQPQISPTQPTQKTTESLGAPPPVPRRPQDHKNEPSVPTSHAPTPTPVPSAQVQAPSPAPISAPDPVPVSHTQSVPKLDGYMIGDVLGKGGFGFVYKALDSFTGAFVAIKKLDLPKEELEATMVYHNAFPSLLYEIMYL